MPIIGDPQGTQARAIDTERKHPVGPQEEAPPQYGRKQLLVVALVIGIPVLLYLLSRLPW
jgi:hypothetical protein